MKVYNYGCSANRAIAEGLMGILKSNDYLLTEITEEADIVIVNTCVVKQNTEHKIKDLLLSLKDVPHLVITGCLPIVMRGWVNSHLPNASILFPDQADQILAKLANQPVSEIKREEAASWAKLYQNPRERYNPIITTIEVARGCLSNCAYCIVKHAKGKLRSRTPESISEEFRSALNAGTREIWLTAQDLGTYGWDFSPQVYLPTLLQQLTHINGHYFIRLGMMTPLTIKKFETELILQMKKTSVFRFLHLPIQSGSDPILKLMQRRETVSEFLELLTRLKERIDELVVATDIIVGFPGESNTDFQATKLLLQTIQPTIVNISKYTDRPGTIAAKMPCKIPTQVKSQRSKELAKLTGKITETNLKEWIGWKGRVLIDEPGKKPHQLQGRNTSYLPVILDTSTHVIGQFVDVEITEAGKSYLLGEICI